MKKNLFLFFVLFVEIKNKIPFRFRERKTGDESSSGRVGGMI